MFKHASLSQSLAVSTSLSLLLPVVALAEDDHETQRSRNPATAIELPTIEVVGNTPLPGLGTALNKVPANVQSLTAEDFENQNLYDFSDMLYRNVGSVTINQAQNNPFQNDVQYRGFLGSPILGSAIGMSLYVDGVRVNEGFGDTINWDLIPQSAISSIDVIPGSNPLFGLNTLGGALALRTKSGFTYQGTEIEASGGSFGRWGVEAEHGGNHGPFDWYIAFNSVDEDGWRSRSPSSVKRLFSKVGWETEKTDIDLSYTFAGNDLIGNGFAPESLLALDRSAVYTFPDQTENKLHFINLRASQSFTDELLLASNFYYRQYTRNTLNGDVELQCVDEEDNPFAVHLARCNGSAVPFGGTGDLGYETEGEDRTTRTHTDSWGGTLQLSNQTPLFEHKNSVSVGLTYDRSDSRFLQQQAEADVLEFGLSRGTARTGDFETGVDITSFQENWGIYLTDTFEIIDKLGLTFSARYQISNVAIRDQTGAEGNADLNGDHSFERFNPAIGLTYSWSDAVNLFGGYSESFRAPTPAELTCADPTAPCNLPNAFVADPPLNPVIGATWEAGVRGRLSDHFKARWNLSFYRTTLSDDLLFSTTQASGAGFFRNVDATRRQGIEFGVNGRWDRLDWAVNYGYVHASYESSEVLASVVEPGGIAISPGKRIPGIPEHNLKLNLDWSVTEMWSIGTSLIYSSDQFMRGDDSNLKQPVDDYAIVNLRTRIRPWKNLELWARIDNLFDSDYETAGIRNFNGFSDPVAEQRFLAPGTPRAGWVGVKVRF